jgi:di/tricarboxylate transporter
MTLDMWLALAILALALLLFTTEWVRVDVVALGVVVALMLTSLLSIEEALSGFSNPVVLIIAALFIVGGAVMNTGLANQVGRRILAIAGTNPLSLTAVIMGMVALLSGFMSDAGVVAAFLPAIIILTSSARISPSKLLIPLAFGALLGGALTLIGTPPNLIISDLLREAGLVSFGFFDYTPIGLVLLFFGILFMLFIGRHLLPERETEQDLQWMETPEELMTRYRLPDDLYRLRVRQGSKVTGQTVTESGLGQRFRVSVLELLRPVQTRRPSLQAESLQRIPLDGACLAANDVLVVQGDRSDVSHATAVLNLGLQPAQADEEDSLITHEVGIAEVLLPPRSSLVGQTVVGARFGSAYRLTVLGISRPGAAGKLDIKSTVLRFGDALLVQGSWQNILALRRSRRDFVVMGEPEVMAGPPTRHKATVALLILAGMLILLVTNVVPTVVACLLAALTAVLAGCLTMDEAYQAVDWKSIVLIACMLPMSIALEKVGLVQLVADGMVNSLGQWGPLTVLAGLFLLTAIFTQILSNTATTVLVAPIALAAAQELGVQPYAFMMGVAIAASMAFASPVASPVNTLVMGAGNYRFGDYVKVGLPMLMIALVVSVFLLPLLWPF